MHGTTRRRALPATARRPGANAVVWLGRDRAVVLRAEGGGCPEEAEVGLPGAPGAMPLALAEVAHRIGDVDRLLVMGREDMRTALEREVVAIGHRPETILDAGPEGPVDRDALAARLRRLA